jgi:hypothetical protein
MSLSNNIALITTIEGDLKDINTLKQGYIRCYEQEAVQCFTEWRKNAGWLKDVPIYCIALTKNTISQETKDIFKELNVNYIEKFYPETELYQNGYWNIPLSGKYFEEELKEDILIKIDLDMYLIKELSKEMFNIERGTTTVGRYDPLSAKHNTNKLTFPERYGQPWDTGLVITHRATGFFGKFYNKLKQITSEFEDGTFESLYGLHIKEHDNDHGVDYGAIEEFAVSIMYTDEDAKLIPQFKYNLGEFYAPIDIYTDEEVQEIYFFHEHIPLQEIGYDKFKTRIEYFHRINHGN